MSNKGIEASDEPPMTTTQPPPPPEEGGGLGVGAGGGLITAIDSVVKTIDSVPLPIVISMVESPEVLFDVTEAV